MSSSGSRPDGGPASAPSRAHPTGPADGRALARWRTRTTAVAVAVAVAAAVSIGWAGGIDYRHGTADHATLILDPHTWRPQSWSLFTTLHGVAVQSSYDGIELVLDAGSRTVIG